MRFIHLLLDYRLYNYKINNLSSTVLGERDIYTSECDLTSVFEVLVIHVTVCNNTQLRHVLQLTVSVPSIHIPVTCRLIGYNGSETPESFIVLPLQLWRFSKSLTLLSFLAASSDLIVLPNFSHNAFPTVKAIILTTDH